MSSLVTSLIRFRVQIGDWNEKREAGTVTDPVDKDFGRDLDGNLESHGFLFRGHGISMQPVAQDKHDNIEVGDQRRVKRRKVMLPQRQSQDQMKWKDS